MRATEKYSRRPAKEILVIFCVPFAIFTAYLWLTKYNIILLVYYSPVQKVAQAETDTYLMIFVSLKYIVSPYGETSSYSEPNIRERSAYFLEVEDREA